jgi:hypothetical protein
LFQLAIRIATVARHIGAVIAFLAKIIGIGAALRVIVRVTAPLDLIDVSISTAVAFAESIVDAVGINK